MIAWPAILERGAEIVDSYSSGVTLRQLFYRLVAEGLIPNNLTAYKTLSSRTAAARREADFPDLVDNTRQIHRPLFFDDADDARKTMRSWFRLDRQKTQEKQVWVAVEKDTLAGLVSGWLEEWGVPVIVARGYPSQTYVDTIREEVDADGRPTVLIYVGDLDPSGEDIDRDLVERCACFEGVTRVAVLPEHVKRFKLSPAPGKPKDARAAGFIERHGKLFQVEVEALDPDDLERIIMQAVGEEVDKSAVDEVRELEGEEKAKL